MVAVYTKTNIISQAVVDRLESKGVKFSLKEDCTAAMLRIATDKSIHGHSLAIVPRDDNKNGYIDAELDDEQDGTYWDKVQRVTLGASIRTSVSVSNRSFVIADECRSRRTSSSGDFLGGEKQFGQFLDDVPICANI